MKKIISFMIISLLLTGCSYTELDKLAIVSALGIDYKQNKFKLTAQVMDVTKSETGGMEEGALIYEAEGETIAKAIRNFEEKYPRYIYLGHLEIFIIGKEVAETKINDIFDYFLRSPETKRSGLILINKDQTAKETLQINNEKQGSFPTEEIKSSLDSSDKRNGTVTTISFDKFLSEYLKEGIDPVAPLIKVEKSNKKDASNTIIKNMAPIKKGKIGPKLNEKQSVAINTINGTYSDIIVTPTYKNKKISTIIYNPKGKVKTTIKNNKIEVDIDIKIDTKLSETEEKLNLKDKKVQKEIKKVVTKEIENYTKDLIDYCKTTNTDILGIKNMIYQDYYKQYSTYKNQNLYEKAKININVKTKLYRYGNTNKGAK